MAINDRNVKEALEMLENEFESQEGYIDDLSDKNRKLLDTIEEFENDISSLEDKVQELEEALAEAYLTSEQKNEQTICNCRHTRKKRSTGQAVKRDEKEPQSGPDKG